MLMPSVALPTGPYDWHPEIVPQTTYETRLARVRAAMKDAAVDVLVVHGNGFDHGALAWLTGFTPKLGPAFALIARAGAPRLLFSGGPGMRPSAERLTWLRDITAIRDLSKDIAAWRSDHAGLGDAALYEGRSMTRAHGRAGSAGLGAPEHSVQAFDGAIDALRRTKSAAEHVRIADAARLLDTAAAALNDALPSHGRHAVALAAERHAYAGGAQDFRIRLGREALGSPVPVEGLDDSSPQGPLRVALAVRMHGYWANRLLLANVDAAGNALAKTVLGSAMDALRPGLRLGDLSSAMQGLRCKGIGLSPEEMPCSDTDVLQEGDIVSAAVDLPIGGRQIPISTLAIIGARGAREVTSEAYGGSAV